MAANTTTNGTTTYKIAAKCHIQWQTCSMCLYKSIDCLTKKTIYI